MARGRIPSLDGLRALSIAFVLIQHSVSSTGSEFERYTTNFGRLGVWVFFVISGFIITHLLLREAIGLLPAIQASPVASPANGFPCLEVTFAGTDRENGEQPKPIENKGESHGPALNGTEWQEKKIGSKGRTRTYNHPVNSRVLYH